VDSFSAVPRASGPVFMFCVSGLIFDDTEGVGSPFRVFRTRTRFRRYRGCPISFSSFSLPASFSTVQRASGPVFDIFCARTRFRWFRGCPIPFSCFALPDSFSTVPRSSGPVSTIPDSFLKYRGCRLPFSCFVLPVSSTARTDGVRSRFHVLCARTHFQRFRGCPIPLSCFALPDTFSSVPWASSPVFIFSASGHIFGGTEGVRSRFHILRSETCF
jgi:hypothetical protein